MFLFFIFVFLLSVEAWLPRDGFDLLNNTVSPGDRKRFLTASSKMRGVNLGALFVMEPWMASTEWQNMGCGDTKSEFDCVTLLGQNLANVRFQAHYDSWTTYGILLYAMQKLVLLLTFRHVGKLIFSPWSITASTLSEFLLAM